jgi:hypothetical protein
MSESTKETIAIWLLVIYLFYPFGEAMKWMDRATYLSEYRSEFWPAVLFVLLLAGAGVFVIRTYVLMASELERHRVDESYREQQMCEGYVWVKEDDGQ